jgi:hypothetical protein
MLSTGYLRLLRSGRKCNLMTLYKNSLCGIHWTESIFLSRYRWTYGLAFLRICLPIKVATSQQNPLLHVNTNTSWTHFMGISFAKEKPKETSTIRYSVQGAAIQKVDGHLHIRNPQLAIFEILNKASKSEQALQIIRWSSSIDAPPESRS